MRRLKAASARERERRGLPSSALERKLWSLGERGGDDKHDGGSWEGHVESLLGKDGRGGERQKESGISDEGSWWGSERGVS